MFKIFNQQSQKPIPPKAVSQPLPAGRDSTTTSLPPEIIVLPEAKRIDKPTPVPAPVSFPSQSIPQQGSDSAAEIAALTESITLMIDRVGDIDKTLNTMGEKISSTEAMYRQLLAEDQSTIRELVQQVRALENHQYREDFLKPVAWDLVGVADAIGQLRDLYASNNQQSQADIIEWIDAIDLALNATMKRCGLVRIPSDVTEVDTRRMKVVAVQHVKPSRNGEVISVNRNGYEWFGEVLRPQEVTVRMEN